jgi:hypothetical protein
MFVFIIHRVVCLISRAIGYRLAIVKSAVDVGNIITIASIKNVVNALIITINAAVVEVLQVGNGVNMKINSKVNMQISKVNMKINKQNRKQVKLPISSKILQHQTQLRNGTKFWKWKNSTLVK